MPTPETMPEQPSRTDDSRSLSSTTAAIILGFLIFVIYLPGLRAPFIFDDENIIVANNAIRSCWPLTRFLFELRPLGLFTFALNYTYGGLNPFGFRLVNLGIHITATCLLFDLCRRLFLLPRFAERYAARATELAFAIAAVWGVHPLQTSAVTYIVQRFESLMGMCFLLALYAFLRGVTATQAKRSWYIVLILAAIVGAATKEIIVVLPLVALLFDRAFFAESWKDVVRRWPWHLACWVAPILVILIANRFFMHKVELVSAGFQLEGMSWWEYLRSQPVVLWHYLGVTFWPARLYIDYGWPITAADDNWRIYGVGVTILAGVLAGLILLLRRPVVGFLVLSWFIILAPTSSILPIADLCFEHRLYLSLATTAALVVLAIDQLALRLSPGDNARKMATLAVMVIIAALCIRTSLRNGDYRSPLQLWTAAADYNPLNARAQNNAAKELVRVPTPSRIEEARQRYEQASKADPKHAIYHDNLGNIYARESRFEEARACYTKGLEVEPTYFRGRLNLSRTLLLLGRDAEAWQVLDDTPETQRNFLELAKLRIFIRSLAVDETLRNPQDALRRLERLQKRNPEWADPDAFALAYAAAGDFEKAREFGEKACEYFQKRGMPELHELAQKKLARFEAGQPWTIELEREHLRTKSQDLIGTPEPAVP